jgi:hypothetical protein
MAHLLEGGDPDLPLAGACDGAFQGLGVYSQVNHRDTSVGSW